MTTTRNIYAGRTPQGERVFIQFRLGTTPWTGRSTLSVHHEPVPPGSPTFAISGHTFRKGANVDTQDYDTGGQILSTFATVRKRHMLRTDGKRNPRNPRSQQETMPELSDAEIRQLADVWQKYHLNDLSAACAHQRQDPLFQRHKEMGTTYIPDPESRLPMSERRRVPLYRPSTELTYGCPEGYRYGSAWLYRPIPEDVLFFLSGLAARFPSSPS